LVHEIFPKKWIRNEVSVAEENKHHFSCKKVMQGFIIRKIITVKSENPRGSGRAGAE